MPVAYYVTFSGEKTVVNLATAKGQKCLTGEGQSAGLPPGPQGQKRSQTLGALDPIPGAIQALGVERELFLSEFVRAVQKKFRRCQCISQFVTSIRPPVAGGLRGYHRQDYRLSVSHLTAGAYGRRGFLAPQEAALRLEKKPNRRVRYEGRGSSPSY